MAGRAAGRRDIPGTGVRGHPARVRPGARRDRAPPARRPCSAPVGRARDRSPARIRPARTGASCRRSSSRPRRPPGDCSASCWGSMFDATSCPTSITSPSASLTATARPSSTRILSTLASVRISPPCASRNPARASGRLRMPPFTRLLPYCWIRSREHPGDAGAAGIVRRQPDVIAPGSQQELGLLGLEGLPRPGPEGLQLEAVLIEAVRGRLEGQHLLRGRRRR